MTRKAARWRRRAVAEFASTLSTQPGFQGYWAIDAGDGVLATITVFETEQAAVDSTDAAGAWIRESMPELASNTPQVTAGSTSGVMGDAPA